MNTVESRLYYDSGSGFRESAFLGNTLRLQQNSNFEVEYSLNGIQISRLRWDPVEGLVCGCEVSEAIVDEQSYSLRPLNSDYAIGNYHVFLSNDPQYVFDKFSATNVQRVVLRGHLDVYDSSEFFRFLRVELEKLKADAAKKDEELTQLRIAIEESEQRISEKDEAAEQLRSILEEKRSQVLFLSDEIQSLKGTVSWRITEPLRKFSQRHLRAKRFLRRILRMFWLIGSLKLPGYLHQKMRMRREYAVVQKSGLFDIRWYLEQNPDVRTAGMDPIQHFLSFGHLEGRDPSPYFDTDWYYTQYPDVAQAKINALFHYIKYGWREGKNPTATFDTQWYLDQNPDVRKDGFNPLTHYVLFGLRKGRKTSNREAQEVHSSARSSCNGVSTLTGNRRRLLSTVVRIDDAVDQKSADLEIIDAFIRRIDGIRVVSFDVFDTLVERSVERPSDVFGLLEINAKRIGLIFNNVDLARQRAIAEKEARRISVSQEVTMEQIYAVLEEHTGLNTAQMSRMRSIEEQLERELLIARPLGVRLLDCALQCVGEVVLISDTYFEKAFIDDLLERLGITGYRELYISSQYGLTKHTGDLFHVAVRNSGCNPDEWLHVGDDPHSDEHMAQTCQLRTFLLPKSTEVMYEHLKSYANSSGSGLGAELWTHAVRGMIASKFFNRSTAVPHIFAEPYKVGYVLLGPLMQCVAQHVLSVARKRNYESLYFVSRDGFYMKEAYDTLVSSQSIDAPASVYLLASRELCRGIGLFTKRDIVEVCDIPYRKTKVRDILATRFLLSDEELNRDLEEKMRSFGFTGWDDRISRDDQKHKSLCRFVVSISTEILEKAQLRRSPYTQYLKRIGIDGKKQAIVDIGYGGSTQRVISRLAGRMGGIYFISWPSIQQLSKDKLVFDSMLTSNCGQTDPLIKYVQLLELFFSATHPSVRRFDYDAQGEPKYVLSKDGLTDIAKYALSEVHKGAMEFVQDFSRKFRDLADYDLNWGRRYLDPVFYFFKQPDPIFVSYFEDVVFSDEFGGSSAFLVVGPKCRVQRRSDAEQISCWIEGARALWDNRAIMRAKENSAVLERVRLQDWEDRFNLGSTMAAWKSKNV